MCVCVCGDCTSICLIIVSYLTTFLLFVIINCCPVLSPVLSCPVLSCPFLSSLILPYSALFRHKSKFINVLLNYTGPIGRSAGTDVHAGAGAASPVLSCTFPSVLSSTLFIILLTSFFPFCHIIIFCDRCS